MSERRIHTIMCECEPAAPAKFDARICEFACATNSCSFRMDEHYAAANRLGPFSRLFDPQRDYKRVPIPGFVQTGPTSYERISEPDAKQVHRDGMAAARKLAKRGDW